MRITPINPYAKLLRDRKYKPQVTKNKKKYDRNKEKADDRLSENHKGHRSG